MANREDYRTRLQAKLIGLEDEGYGDLEFEDEELDFYLELTVAELFPELYKVIKVGPLTVTTYGTSGYLGQVSSSFPDRVFLVEDATELTPIYGWLPRPTSIVGLNTDLFVGTKSVNLYYYDAFALPADDTTDAGIAGIYTPLIVLGALIGALESRHDTGVRPDPTAGHQEVGLIDRLQHRYDAMRNRLAMALPAVQG